MSDDKPSWWMERNEQLTNPDAKRLSAAFLAFTQSTPLAWEVRKLLIAAVLNISPSAVELALQDLKRAGLVRDGWMS